MTRQHLAFVDESGHTGGNILDPQQPVFVAAGWVLRRKKSESIAAVVEEARQMMNMKELKGGRLLSTGKGRSTMLHFLKRMQQHAIPVFSIWEKRFCVALKAVETFLDFDANPAARWLPARANVQRFEVAELILALPPEHLVRFWSAYCAPTSPSLGESAKLMGLALRLRGEETVGTSIAACVGATLDSVVATLQEPEIEPGRVVPRNVITSIGFPAFSQLLRAIDTLFEAAGAEGVVIHDASKEFGPSFEETYRAFRSNGTDHTVMFEDGGSLRSGIGSIKKFVMADSRGETGIQAADVLAGIIRGLGQMALGLTPQDGSLDECGALLLPGLLNAGRGAQPWAVTASESFRAALMQPIFRTMQRAAKPRSSS